jgi:hypothetical protein
MVSRGFESSSLAFREERAELQRILGSGIFDRSPNLYRILLFICEKYFEQKAHEIKEYSVAVEALGRPADFDQKKDSIVRVEAHRLRKRLDDYYDGPGASHEVHIDLPAGGYVPRFRKQDEPAMNGRPGATSSGSKVQNHQTEIADNAPKMSDAGTRAKPVTLNSLVPMLLGAMVVVGLLFFGSDRFFPSRGSATNGAPGPESVAPDTSLTSMPAGIASAGQQEVRILAGSPVDRFVDRFGNVWMGDAYFHGGNSFKTQIPFINFTSNPEIYAYRREGPFRYDIPLAPGNYELRMHFLESVFGRNSLGSGGETSRIFTVQINGETVYHMLDIIKDAYGEGNADVKILRNVSPADDGMLHIGFRHEYHEHPVISAIEVIPSADGKMLPVRLLANDRPFVDAAGLRWNADNYFKGGVLVRRPTPLNGVEDSGLYQAERFGNFRYMIPVAEGGLYTLTLKFCERWFGPQANGGGGPGSRIFNVSCNGRMLLEHFDVFSTAGGRNRPIERTFRGLRPNAQGKLVLDFIPIQNYALINAIEVTQEGR